MAIFGASVASAAIIRLRCPRCYEIQARARGPAGTTYACRVCHHVFDVEQGTPTSDEEQRASSRRRGR